MQWAREREREEKTEVEMRSGKLKFTTAPLAPLLETNECTESSFSGRLDLLCHKILTPLLNSVETTISYYTVLFL